MRFVSAICVSSVLAAFALFDCSSPSPCTGTACVDASQVPGVSGGGCDTSKPASQGGCAVDDSDGFFVSPTGSDTASGAKTTPFQTINHAIVAAAANTQKPNVYVCAGTYAENLVIQNAPAGVALHGGFDCASWAQTSAPTNVAPAWQTSLTTGQFVLHVLGVAAVVESMTLTAPDATDPGGSSVAAWIDGSPGMTFRRATVTAGKGMDAPALSPVSVLAANADGNSAAANSYIGGASKTCPCTKDSTIGGQGGSTGADAGAPQNGLPTIAGNPDAGLAGTQGGCVGGSGASGLASTTNGSSTGTYGALSATGWNASSGNAGGTGGTAQGGGGAEWDPGNGLGGGGGACGGCGGGGGAGGAGGGASIAIGALTSTLRIQASTIHAGKAGNGADGVVGQPGQPGGNGGKGATTMCTGGNGGTGGGGGAGGGGAGGVSIGIATFATTPDVDSQSTVLSGTAGAGGHDATTQATKAVDGIAGAVHSF